MSLLDDLQDIDLSGIVEARGTISASVSSPELRALIEGGAAQAVLGDLGGSLATLRTSVESPTALLEPLLGAINELAGPLDLGNVDISRYLGAVEEGADILSRLLTGLDTDPASLLGLFGVPLGDELQRFQQGFGDVTAQLDLGEAARLRELVALADGGLPANPATLADLAMEFLLPFPGAGLRSIRGSLDSLLDGAEAVRLPLTRTEQLVLSLDAVATAAATGDAPLVQRALREVASVRASTQAALTADLQAVAGAIDRLGVEAALEAVASAGAGLQFAGDGIIDFLERLRVTLSELRAGIAGFDPQQAVVFIEMLLAQAEAQARTHIVEAIDAQVERLKEWLRGLLRHLPLRELRAELTAFIQSVAQAIVDADLDRYARQAQEFLAGIRDRVSAADLGEQVRAALERAAALVMDALDAITASLSGITAEINAVADQARAVLVRVADAISGFQATIDGIVAAINDLGIDEATQQVIDRLRTLRETAEELLSDAPLPEPIRPLVEQLIEAIKDVDVSQALAPVREAANELALPADIEATITDALAAARDAVANLIPTELIASIQAEVEAALEEISSFDPGSLLGGVTNLVEEAAAFIEGLDPRPHVAVIRAPFLAVLDGFDRAHPVRLLAPVTRAYDSLFGSLNLPDPGDAARKVGETVNQAGEGMARAVVEPVRQMAPPGAVEVADVGAPAGPPEDLSLEGARPGDVVRMLGYLPMKLREVLAQLEAGPAGEVLATLDGLLGGLAEALRRAPDALWAIDARLADDLDALLAPLGQAQVRAQVALQINFGGSSASLDLDGALTAVAAAGPAPMRQSLAAPIGMARDRAIATANRSGGDLGVTLDRIATLLEGSSLSGVLGNLDDFLAALDPEPIAAEVDALVEAVIRKAPEIFAAVGAQLQDAVVRARMLLEEMSPTVQAQKFLTVIDVLREELDLLNPARLAAELGEVHQAIRDTIAAYDPAIFAESVAEILGAIAGQLRALDPAALLGGLGFLDDIAARVEAALPLNALAGVGDALAEVGERLVSLDPGALLEATAGLPGRVLDAVEKALEAIKQEIITLLESLTYFAASGRVEVSGSVGGGT